MKRTLMFVSTVFVALMAMVFSGTGTVWAAPQGGPVAEEYVSPEGIQFIPIIPYKYIEVILSFPNGQIARKNFEGDPYFNLGQSWGPKWTDGPYTYELRAYQEHDPQGEWRDPKFEGIYTPLPIVQTGFFTVFKGAIEPKVEEEEGQQPKGLQASKSNLSKGGADLSRTKDHCIYDDLIVDGSLCVGFDCTCDNMSFGFDTIVLKENNLRIFFDDTSVAASYPRNDWRITINDSANGGGSYFGVEDATAARRVFTLEAGAPSHSLYVDDGGRVGLGLSTPSLELHIKDGDTPSVRLDQDGSSGFAPQVWDVAGNETNFFIRDVTSGSTLPFRIRPGAPSSSIFIDTDGDVGLGTTSITAGVQLEVEDSADTYIVAQKTGQASAYFSAATGYAAIGSSTDDEVRFVTNGSNKMTLDTSGGITMAVGGGSYNESTGEWVNGSSRAYKEDIEKLDLKSAQDALENLEPVTFKMKVAPKGSRQVGFIAEDVPQLVAQEDRKGLAPMDIVAVLTKVLKDQQKQLKNQEQIIKLLQKKVAELESK